jgi:hypothetical protein
MEDFEWNAEVKWDPDIPADYELVMSIPEVVGDEEHAVAGLSIYARVTNGRFPSTLSMETAIREARSSLGQGEQRFRDIEDVWNIYSAGKFYQQLMRDGMHPVYFGNRLRLGDEGVLLRWTVGPDQFRAIMGDLTVMDLTGEELLNLER